MEERVNIPRYLTQTLRSLYVTLYVNEYQLRFIHSNSIGHSDIKYKIYEYRKMVTSDMDIVSELLFMLKESIPNGLVIGTNISTLIQKESFIYLKDSDTVSKIINETTMAIKQILESIESCLISSDISHAHNTGIKHKLEMLHERYLKILNFDIPKNF